MRKISRTSSTEVASRCGHGSFALEDGVEYGPGIQAIDFLAGCAYEELNDLRSVVDIGIERHGSWPEHLGDRDRARRLELIPDIANELLNDVLEGEDADLGVGRAQDNRHVLARVLEFV
jgi:hypothetical protein